MATTTVWATSLYPGIFTFSKHIATDATFPAGVATIDLTLNASVGSPTLFLLDVLDYSSWTTVTSDIPKSYFLSAPAFAPLTTTLTFPQNHSCSFFIKCGPYPTTIDGTPTIVSQNCSGVAYTVRWATSAYTSPLISPTSTPPPQDNPGSSGLSVGAAAGIAVGAVAVVAAIAVAVYFSLRRKKISNPSSSSSQQLSNSVSNTMPPQLYPNNTFPPQQPLYMDPNQNRYSVQPPYVQQQYHLPPPSPVFPNNNLNSSNQSGTVVQGEVQGSSGSGNKGIVMLKP
ncbi:hypothetical protein BJ742DRAFT_824434 [Cladochytrium replicatum]|nr:hypothetical protein BJ742DRAFT_824434 [Cladochytrium replicatum]